MNRLPCEQDGGQANGWGHSVSKTQFLVCASVLLNLIDLMQKSN